MFAKGDGSTADGVTVESPSASPERKNKFGFLSPLLRGSPARGGGRRRNNPTSKNPPPSGQEVPTPETLDKIAAPVAPPLASPGSKTAGSSTDSLTAKRGDVGNPPRSASPEGAPTTLPQPHWMCRSKFFRNLCQSAFEAIDVDQSGTIDEKELYSGLLLIHLKLGCYAGPAACRPLSRERCLAFFRKMDADGSGSLDKEEFHRVMGVLFGNVLLRVLAQWSLTLTIVPLMAQTVLNAIYAAVRTVSAFVANLDEHSAVADSIELTVEGTWQCLVETTPDAIVALIDRLHHYLSFVPDSVWNSIPLTLLSTLLGLVVVPWTLFQIDDFFQYVAERRQDRRK